MQAFFVRDRPIVSLRQ